METQAYLTPWNIGGGVAGFVLSVGTLISLVRNRRHVGTALARMGTRLFSQIGFFSLVIVVFMVISVLESGDFFNRNITHDAVFGLLGYALALGFDLVSVVCMLARLNAERMRDERGSRLNLVGVIICAAVSAFANASGSLQGYASINLNHTPTWMQSIAPWLSMIFPAMIVILSMTTDHILDHAPTRGVDVDTFRAREQKRVDLLQVRLDTERDLLTIETELSTLRRDREQASGRIQREWLIWRWLRPVVPAPSNTLSAGLKAEIDQAMQAVRTTLEERLEELHTTLHTLDTQVNTWTTEVAQHLGTLRTQMDQTQEQVGTLHTQKLDDGPTTRPGAQGGQEASHAQRVHREQGTSTDRGRRHPSDVQGQTARAETEEQGNIAGRILATFHRLGASPRYTNCSRG